jgi:hypothetical protein
MARLQLVNWEADMAFWNREPDPDLEAARAEAEETLPSGWEIYRSDREKLRVPTGRVVTYAISAAGPGNQTALVIAVGEANAYRQFARLMRGELVVAEGWGVPLTTIDPKPPKGVSVVLDENDPAVATAKRELDAALPQGWTLFDVDPERYYFPKASLETAAVAVQGAAGEAELVMGIEKAGALHQMVHRLRGELEVAEAWAPPMDHRIQR